MNWKVVGPIIVVLAVIAVAPLIMNKMNSPAKEAATSAAPAAPQPAAAPPLLDAAKLANSAWKVTVKGVPVPVDLALNAGGQAVVSVGGPLAAVAKAQYGADSFTGTWSVDGATLNFSFTLGKDTKTMKAEIIGDKIYTEDKGVKKEMQRVK
jgi:hypothetical protein